MLLAIGRLHRQKDFPTLIRAAARVHHTMPLRLVIIGGGPSTEATRLLAIAAEEGIEENFLLAGETDNVFAWLVRARAFALTSRWEGSSMALLEALATGVPVVATRQAGDAVRVLDNGRYGRLAGAGNVDEIADALRDQLSPRAIRPGHRSLDYRAEVTLDAYAAVVDQCVRRGAARRTSGSLAPAHAGR